MNMVSVDPKYTPLLQNITSFFEASSQSVHKARNELKVIDFENEKLLVKSFKIPHFINKIAYTFFRDSKAKKSYYNTLRLGQFAPEAIGYLEMKKHGLLERSYFVSARFAYDFTIREPLLDSHFPDREKIFRAFALFTAQLHEAGIEHLDYSPGNILIKATDDGYIFKIVDVNRMKFKNLTTRERLQNFSKLWAKDADLKIMIDAYADATSLNREEAWEIARKASQQHKDRKNFKKRLKGIPVVD